MLSAGSSSGSGVEAPAENFFMAGSKGGRWLTGCGGGGVAAAVAAGRGLAAFLLRFVLFFDEGVVDVLVVLSSTWIRPVLGQGGVRAQ